jgi:tripeptide aminopeptidase
MFNEELLIEVLGWQSESSKEKEQIIPTLNKYLKILDKKHSLVIEEDAHGNIYVTKGKASLYPCIVSHLDQVHRFCPNKTIVINGDYLLAFDGARQVGTGGDDLVGVFMCLNLLDNVDNIKVVFFLQEEIGCIGSNACDLDFFKDCKFIGQADRKGNADFINYSNGVKLFDEEFSKFVGPILEDYKYKECTGIATDAGALSKRNVGIACFNISCGYHNPHTSTEYVVISQVEVCYNVILDIILSADKQYTYVRPANVSMSKLATDNKTKLYNMLYEEFKHHPKYIKSNKMNYAYSLAISFIDELIMGYDKMVDELQPDYPYISDQLEEYLDYLKDQREDEQMIGEPSKTFKDTSLSKQLGLFDKDCQHRNVKYDNTMAQYYCMDCFNYVDDKSTFYDQETLNARPGYGYMNEGGYY